MFPILIVDDSRADLELAERVLKEARIANPIHLFSTPAACLDFLRKRYTDPAMKDAPRPLMLIDLAMPAMSGVELIAAIQHSNFVPPPWMVMLSGQGDIKQVREGYLQGAKTFLMKPLRGEDVAHFVGSNAKTIRNLMRATGHELQWEHEAV